MTQTLTVTPPARQTSDHEAHSDQVRYPVDPSSPEFTDLLLECFIDGRNKAIDANNRLIASGVVKEDQVG